MTERLNAKKRQLILSFAGRADVPTYPNGRLAGHIADLRKMGIVAERYLTPYGQVVATALINGQRIPSREEATADAVRRAVGKQQPPRRCETGLVDTVGECLACDADQGEACRAKNTAQPSPSVAVNDREG